MPRFKPGDRVIGIEKCSTFDITGRDKYVAGTVIEESEVPFILWDECNGDRIWPELEELLAPEEILYRNFRLEWK